MTSKIYRMDLRGAVAGQQNQSTIWIMGDPDDAVVPSVTNGMAEAHNNWAFNDRAKWLTCKPTNYRIDTVLVTVYDAASGLPSPTWPPMTFSEGGLIGSAAGAFAGTASAVTVGLTMGAWVPTAVGGVTAKRAYMAFGPTAEDNVTNDGTFDIAAGIGPQMVVLFDELFQGTQLHDGITWTPVRGFYELTPSATPPLRGYRQVVDYIVSDKANFRRSRVVGVGN